jgi:hypothetical protein
MSRRRPITALPFGINLSDYDFEPSKAELVAESRRRNWLAKMRSLLICYEREADELRRRRAAEIAREIEVAKEKQEREDRLSRDRDYWLREREKDRGLMTQLTERYQQIVDDSPFRRKMLAKLAEVAKLQKDIDRLAAREERKALLARGVVRGRRKV